MISPPHLSLLLLLLLLLPSEVLQHLDRMFIIESRHRARDSHTSVINCVAVRYKSDVIPYGGGPQHPNARVDDEHECKGEDREIDGDGHRPVFLGQEVQTS